MKIKKAYLLTIDGLIRRLPELENKEMMLDDMYRIIDCHTIEHVGLKKGIDLWIDEEGLFQEFPRINPIATKFYREANPLVPFQELGIVGNAILTDNTRAGNFIKI
jgi:hypothetical protein